MIMRNHGLIKKTNICWSARIAAPLYIVYSIWIECSNITWWNVEVYPSVRGTTIVSHIGKRTSYIFAMREHRSVWSISSGRRQAAGGCDCRSVEHVWCTWICGSCVQWRGWCSSHRSANQATQSKTKKDLVSFIFLITMMLIADVYLKALLYNNSIRMNT